MEREGFDILQQSGDKILDISSFQTVYREHFSVPNSKNDR